MAPLIDCVFLLLIFFLVTTMIRKWESQIPVTLPEMTSSPAERKNRDQTPVISLGTDGSLHEVVSQDAYTGETQWRRLSSLPEHLASLRQRFGSDFPLEIAADREIPVERVIAVFDDCQNAGFTQTRVRLGSQPDENSSQ